MDNRFILTLIRHLPTKGNMEKRYIGWTDESILPPESNIQLPWSPDFVYGSDLKRCIESAKMYFPNVCYIQDKRLRESYFGEWEGKTYDMLKEISTYQEWLDKPQVTKPPNGEDFFEVKRRVMAAIKDLPTHLSHHFIVTHGGPIRILLTEFSPEEQDFWSWEIPHQSVWHLTWESVQAFKEGKRCRSLSAEPITAK